MVLVLNVDNTPSVLATADLLAINNDRLLGTDNSEGDEALNRLLVNVQLGMILRANYLDLSVNRLFLLVKLIVVIGVHLEVVESELLLDALLESLSLLQS